MDPSVSSRKLNTLRERELQSNLRVRVRNRLSARLTKHPTVDSDSAVLQLTFALKVLVAVSVVPLVQALDSLPLMQHPLDQSERTPTYTDSINTVSYLL